MIEILDDFLAKYNLNSQDSTILVGFSGGCDSLCLLDMLFELRKKYNFKLVALHLNHNWRGDEAKVEELNCQRFCDKKGIEFVVETLSGEEQKSEKVAREARYEFFIRHAKQYKNSSVFTAHTKTDNAETLIYRIVKGTGIKGLQGILPATIRERVAIYRPLLKISRDETQNYCIAKGLIANVDSSNQDLSYKRNFIRHNIMPLFKEINYNYEKSIVSLAGLAIDQNKIADEYIKLIKRDIYQGDRIVTEKFKKLSPEIMKKIIYDVCIREDWDYDYKKVAGIVDFIRKNLDSRAGSKYSVSKDIWIFANENYIKLIRNKAPNSSFLALSVTGEGEYNIPNSNFDFSIQKYTGERPLEYPKEDDLTAYVSIDNFENLVLRHRIPGDVIYPFGMTGSMKLKKYLNAKGVLQAERDELVLLCRGSEVLWVVGVGLSNSLRVMNFPTHVIKMVQKNK
jgi:tRNA(Ile)-lysidine synthase